MFNKNPNLGDVSIGWLRDLFDKMLIEGKMPEDWRKSFIVSIIKGKRDIQECGNYEGIKLMSHSMKIREKIIEKRIRSETSISDKISLVFCQENRQRSHYFVLDS